MLKIALKSSLTWAVGWLAGSILVRYFRHGQVVREDVLEALEVSATLLVFSFFLELYRAKRERSAERSNAA